MKALLKTALSSVAFVSCLLSFKGCTKDITPKTSTAISAPDAEDVAGVTYDPNSGRYKLVIQPGPKDGQDAWIDWNAYNPVYANGNSGSIDQIKILGWTIDGDLTKSRSLIRFNGLSQVPATAKVVKVKLILTGLSSSPVHLPQGNYGDNVSYVQAITSPWDESNVTWNTQPSTTDLNKATLPASTSQWNYNATVDVTKLVAPMVANPSSNYGFMIKLATENVYRSMGFYSSEAAVKSTRPKLVVIYTL